MIQDEYVKYKQIPGHEGYGVSTDGCIYSFKTSKVLKPKYSRGYLRVRLSHNNIAKDYSVHRLVAITYIPNIDDNPFINHINANRADNRVENLEWCTQSENVRHCVKMKRHKGMSGRNHTEDAKAKISKAKTGKTHSPYHKEKIRQSLLGRVVSEATKAKMRKPHRGKSIIDITSGRTYVSISQYERETNTKEWKAYQQIKKGEVIYDK